MLAESITRRGISLEDDKLKPKPVTLDTTFSDLPQVFPDASIQYSQELAVASWKQEMKSDAVNGWYRGLTVRPGLSMVLADLHFSDESVYSHVSGDHLKLHFRLSGSSVIGSHAKEDLPVPVGMMSFLVQPPDTLKYERIVGQSHERSVTMICSKDFVSDLFGQQSSEAPASLIEYLRSGVSRFSSTSLPVHPQMWTIVDEIMRPGLPGALDALLVEAKSLELLCLAVRQILNNGHSAENIRERDRKKVEDLCRMLEADSQATLSISEMSKQLAWNETQMMECFKQVMGTTISNYRQQGRMELALKMLRDTDNSITEIAFSAGYDHPGNFSTAFKRTFGFSPRRARFGDARGELE
jgi:AraC-like DNA-binding protein